MLIGGKLTMKKNKIILSFALVGLLFVTHNNALTSVKAETADPYQAAYTASNWTFARTNFKSTKDGLLFEQTEMGIPDNHAISILEVPFNDDGSFEITFKMKMDEYIAGGRNANDVWAGIGIMGKPMFINWRNNEEAEPSPLTGHGRAKESPGLFTRFFNYSGDLRYEGSIYQENYHILGEESGPEDIVDTWSLYEGNAGAGIRDEITLKMSYDKESENKEFYNIYINNVNITPAGQAAFINREIVFPEGKIYLLLVMNTQQDDFNELSTLLVKSINGVSFTNETPTTPDEPSETPSEPVTSGDGDLTPSETPNKGSGCASTTIVSSLTIIFILVAVAIGISFKAKKVSKGGR